MLRVNASQLTPSTIPFSITQPASFPEVIAASGSFSCAGTVTVPSNEMWQVYAAGFVISVSAGNDGWIVYARAQITTFQGITVTVPVSIANDSVVTGAAAQVGSLALAGVQLSPGDQCFFVARVQNQDAVNAVNITDVSGGLRFLRMALVSDLLIPGS